jgi:hypothetical protein
MGKDEITQSKKYVCMEENMKEEKKEYIESRQIRILNAIFKHRKGVF